MGIKTTKDQADEIMKLEGETRGAVFKTDEKFILYKGGEGELAKVEEKIKEWGYSLNYKETGTMDFYPIGLRVLSILAVAEVFGFDEEQVKNEIGLNAPKMSFIVKVFAQHFFSVKKTFEQVSKLWARHYSRGKLIPAKLDEEKNFLVLELEDFNIHPIMCSYLSGYFKKISEIVLKKEVEIEEGKCSYRGDDKHIFTIKW